MQASPLHKASQEPLWLALRFPSLPRELQGGRGDEGDSEFERNKKLEQYVLRELTECCYHFSPYVETQNRSAEPGLLLELSRCLKLFRGVEALSRGLFKQLRAFGYRFEYGLAHTPAAAWLLSWQQHPVSDDDTREVFMQRLQATPIYLLQSNEKIIQALDKTGFSTLGDVIKQIQHSSLGALRKRFGEELSHYLQDVFAIESRQQQISLFRKPAKPYQPRVYFCEHRQPDYPLDKLDLLKPLMEELLIQLQQFLKKYQLQSQSIVWRFFDIYHNAESITVNTCQLHKQDDKPSWQLFLELSLIQLERQALPFAVDTLELRCEKLEDLKPHSGLLAFSGTSKNNREELQITLARVKARLGEDAIYKVSYRPHHVPEKSVQRIALSERANTDMGAQQLLAKRPCWLLKMPQPIQRKKNVLYWQGNLELLEGPERIEGYWWEEYCARDYFIAQREDNVKLWVYRDLQNQGWYTHGIFS